MSEGHYLFKPVRENRQAGRDRVEDLSAILIDQNFGANLSCSLIQRIVPDPTADSRKIQRA